MRIVLFVLFTLSVFSLQARSSRVGNLWSYEKFTPDQSVQEYYDRATLSFIEGSYDEALTNYLIVVHHFPESPFYADSVYHSGVTYYHLGHYDLANEQFSRYFELPGALKFFEEVVEYKFQIANHFKNGYKKHPFGIATLPRLASAKQDAVKLFDEVAAALPNKEIAATAMFYKGMLLKELKEYREAVDEFQTLARRFPNHPLAADGYLQMGEVYLEQSLLERQNADYISLAKLNKEKFEKAFPSDERVSSLDRCLLLMLESQALNLFETGKFYERKGQKEASLIYYKDTVLRYPGTEAAQLSTERITRLEKR